MHIDPDEVVLPTSSALSLATCEHSVLFPRTAEPFAFYLPIYLNICTALSPPPTYLLCRLIRSAEATAGPCVVAALHEHRGPGRGGGPDQPL
jgi:hypothetical protein